MVYHPIRRCFVLNDKIQALVDAGILTLKSKQKKVTANMVTINFGNFPKVTVQDGLAPIPKGRMEVTNPLPKKQETESHSVDDQIL